jgi:hypothetical protein
MLEDNRRGAVKLAPGTFPPVAVLVVNTAPALKPRSHLLALLARLLSLGVIAVAAAARCIQESPVLKQRRHSVGRSARAEGGAEHGQRQRDGRPRPPPGRRSSAARGRKIVGCPHPVSNIGSTTTAQAQQSSRNADRRVDALKGELERATAPGGETHVQRTMA